MNGTVEDRLRQALGARAASVEPADGLRAIEHRVTVLRRRRWAARAGALGVAAALVAGGIVVVAGLGDDRETIDVRPTATTNPAPAPTAVAGPTATPTTVTGPPTSTPATTTAVAPTTAGAPVTPVTTAGPVGPVPTTTAVGPVTTPVTAATGIWPAPGAPPFFSARAAALDAARALIGMAPTAEVVGQARMTGTDTAVVDVRARPGGRARTHVLTRQTPTGWVVEAVTSDDVVLTEPGRGARVRPTFAVSGEATAFEATIAVETRALGATGPAPNRLGTMAGANGEMGRFATVATLPEGVAVGDSAVLVVGVPDMSGEGDLDSAAIVVVVRVA